MAHIIPVLGHTLLQMLLHDGGTLQWMDVRDCCVRLRDGRRITIPLNAVIHLPRMKSICGFVRWNASRFDELRQRVIHSDISPSAIVVKPDSRLH